MDKRRRPFPQKARERIQAIKLIDKLMQHIEGEVQMTPSQVNAARILLNKVLPDLKAVEHSGGVEQEHSFDDITLEQAFCNALKRTEPSS